MSVFMDFLHHFRLGTAILALFIVAMWAEAVSAVRSTVISVVRVITDREKEGLA